MSRSRQRADRRPPRADGDPAGRDDAQRPAPGRDRAADRALFERAVEALGAIERGGGDAVRSSGPAPLAEKEAASAGAERRAGGARFARRIARGELDEAPAIDLHGLDREQALVRIRRGLTAAPPGAVVRVIHGRGRGILEQVATAELDRHPRVAEHLPAPPRLGGSGARLVRLR